MEAVLQAVNQGTAHRACLYATNRRLQSTLPRRALRPAPVLPRAVRWRQLRFKQGARATVGPLNSPEDQRRVRFVDILQEIPQAVADYFKNPSKKALFSVISLLGGFYVAQTISLSFGALGVNDVVASALCVVFTEIVTRYYYTRKKPTLAAWYVNVFKFGFTYGFFIDSFKLAG